MKRLLRFVLTLIAGVLLVTFIRRMIRQLSPESLQRRAGGDPESLSARVSTFVTTVRREADAYETELRQELNLPAPQ